MLEARVAQGDARFRLNLKPLRLLNREELRSGPTAVARRSERSRPRCCARLHPARRLLKAPPEYQQQTIIDAMPHPVISLASVAAKVSRRSAHGLFSEAYPDYGFERH